MRRIQDVRLNEPAKVVTRRRCDPRRRHRHPPHERNGRLESARRTHMRHRRTSQSMLQLLCRDVSKHPPPSILFRDDGEPAARSLVVESAELAAEGFDRVGFVEGDDGGVGVEDVERRGGRVVDVLDFGVEIR